MKQLNRIQLERRLTHQQLEESPLLLYAPTADEIETGDGGEGV